MWLNAKQWLAWRYKNIFRVWPAVGNIVEATRKYCEGQTDPFCDQRGVSSVNPGPPNQPMEQDAADKKKCTYWVETQLNSS